MGTKVQRGDELPIVTELRESHFNSLLAPGPNAVMADTRSQFVFASEHSGQLMAGIAAKGEKALNRPVAVALLKPEFQTQEKIESLCVLFIRNLLERLCLGPKLSKPCF